jgi:hypothetical protein
VTWQELLHSKDARFEKREEISREGSFAPKGAQNPSRVLLSLYGAFGGRGFPVRAKATSESRHSEGDFPVTARNALKKEDNPP